MPVMREFVEDVCKANDFAGLWRAAIKSFNAAGFPMVSYHHFPPLGATGEDDFLVVFHGFPDALVEAYLDRKQHRVNPLTRVAKLHSLPFLWSEALLVYTLSDEERAFWREVQEFGLVDGLSVPLFGPGGRNGLLGLAFTADNVRTVPELERHHIQNSSQACHLRYCELINQRQGGQAQLTPREREILEWVARGKSNGVISDIVGISSNTVDTHLRRIYAKLGVVDRLSAVMRGMGAGQIAAW